MVLPIHGLDPLTTILSAAILWHYARVLLIRRPCGRRVSSTLCYRRSGLHISLHVTETNSPDGTK